MASGSVAETLLPTPLVGIDWLARHLDAPDVKVLDGSWHMPATARDGRAEFEAGHIPGARFFDIDEIADRESPYPHMLPTADAFAAAAGALGLTNRDRIVIYDTGGLFGAARVWWMVRAFGHDRVAVLDGGLAAWQAAGLPLETGTAAAEPANFEAKLRPELVVSVDEVARASAHGSKPIADARSAGRFEGREPEPRPGLPSGHMPGSRNLPHTSLLSGEGRLKAPDALAADFRKAGLDPAEPMIASCGSGVSACVIALAGMVLGSPSIAVYDGSWAEWASASDRPIRTGPADS